MPREIYLVKVGMTMTEGMVSEWFVPDGSEVKKGEMLYALETEKVKLDVDAEADGVVKHIVDIGVMLEPGDVVGYIFEAGETIPDDLPSPSKQADAVEMERAAVERAAVEQAAVEQAAVGQSVAAQPAIESVAGASVNGHIKASPAARRLAGELGIDYRQLRGTGPGGRIIESDVSGARGLSVAPAIAMQSADVKASPLARRIAEQRGIDLRLIEGSGPGGRIVQADLDAAPVVRSAAGASAGPSTSPSTSPSTGSSVGPKAGEIVPLRGMRKTIAQRMHQSLQDSAQLTMDMAAIMDDAVKLRTQLISEWEGIARPTFTDLVIKAAAKALQKHPLMNSQYDSAGIQLLNEIHIGIAVALPEGLVVPVVRNADKLDLKAIAIESARVAAAAREGSLGLDDYAGGTFTISALGMYGVDSFTPIINQPQSGILGVNRIFDGLSWDGDKPVRQQQMNLSLTWDHRVLDGAPAAEFLQTVVEYLSEPYRLLV